MSRGGQRIERITRMYRNRTTTLEHLGGSAGIARATGALGRGSRCPQRESTIPRGARSLKERWLANDTPTPPPCLRVGALRAEWSIHVEDNVSHVPARRLCVTHRLSVRS